MATPMEDNKLIPRSNGMSETIATSKPISSLSKRVMNSRTIPYGITGTQNANRNEVDPTVLRPRRKRTVSFELFHRLRPIRNNAAHLTVKREDGDTFPGTMVPATMTPISVATDTASPSTSSRQLPRRVIAPGAYAVRHGEEPKVDLYRLRAF